MSLFGCSQSPTYFEFANTNGTTYTFTGTANHLNLILLHIRVDNMNLPPLVHNKASFRSWCAYMMLDISQATGILKKSTPMIYKYLDPQNPTKLSVSTMIICNLINELPLERRMEWFKSALETAQIKSTWPSANPISQ